MLNADGTCSKTEYPIIKHYPNPPQYGEPCPPNVTEPCNETDECLALTSTAWAGNATKEIGGTGSPDSDKHSADYRWCNHWWFVAVDYHHRRSTVCRGSSSKEIQS